MRLLQPRSRVFLVVLIIYSCSKFGSVSPTDSLGRVNLITKLPFAGLFLFFSDTHTANVWIPETPPAKDADGSVQDEYAEVATVFAKPEAKLVESEVLPSEQAVPWTSLKQEWDLYKKFHENKNRRQSDQSTSSEDSEEEEEEDEEEQGDAVEKLPQAFYGQQNADDDERDFLQSQKDVYADKKKKRKKNKEESDEEEEEDEEESDIVEPDASSISDIQGLEQLTDDEKQAIIDKIFAGAAIAPQAFTPTTSGISGESEEEDSSPPKKKGEDEDEEQDDDDGGGKKDKGKKKKKKKKKGKKKGGGGGGWGWKKPIVIPIPPPKKDAGWGWKHDGLLEQLVKGSTWERVLNYYHHTHDASENNKGDGWGEEKPGDTAHATGEKLVTKLFKGSFWDRAFQTYSQYKNSKPSKPAKEYTDTPVKIDW